MALVLAAGCPVARAETCVASFYGAESGSRTASGERFIPSGLTAAHRTARFHSHLRVCRADQCVVVRVNDRGPFVRSRCLDLSAGAARAIGMRGTGLITIERLD